MGSPVGKFQTKLASLNVSLVRRVTSSPSSVGRRRHGGGPLRSAVVATWPWLASSSLTDHLCLCCDAIYCKSCSMLARTGCVVKLRHAPRRSRTSADGFSPSSSKPNNLNERLEVGREEGRKEGRKEGGRSYWAIWRGASRSKSTRSQGQSLNLVETLRRRKETEERRRRRKEGSGGGGREGGQRSDATAEARARNGRMEEEGREGGRGKGGRREVGTVPHYHYRRCRHCHEPVIPMPGPKRFMWHTAPPPPNPGGGTF